MADAHHQWGLALWKSIDTAPIEPLAQDKWRAFVNLVGSTLNIPTDAVHETRWSWWCWWWRVRDLTLYATLRMWSTNLPKNRFAFKTWSIAGAVETVDSFRRKRLKETAKNCKTDKDALFLWRLTYQVFLGKTTLPASMSCVKVFRVTLSRLRLWASMTCTGCKNWGLVKRHLERKRSRR